MLEDTWSDLFMLCILQWSLPLESSPILPAAGKDGATSPELTALSDVLLKMRVLHVS